MNASCVADPPRRQRVRVRRCLCVVSWVAAAANPFGRHIVAHIFRRHVDGCEPIELLKDGRVRSDASEQTKEVGPPANIHRVGQKAGQIGIDLGIARAREPRLGCG